MLACAADWLTGGGGGGGGGPPCAMAQEQANGGRSGHDEDRGGDEKSEYERRGEERSDYERGDENQVGQDDDGHLVVQVLLLALPCVLLLLLHFAETGAASGRLTSARLGRQELWS